MSLLAATSYSDDSSDEPPPATPFVLNENENGGDANPTVEAKDPPSSSDEEGADDDSGDSSGGKGSAASPEGSDGLPASKTAQPALSAKEGDRSSVHEYDTVNLDSIAVKGFDDSWTFIAEQADLKETRDNCIFLQLNLRQNCMYFPPTGEDASEATEDPNTSAGTGTPVSPAAVAQTAVSKMHLRAPRVESTPNDSDTLGAVGLPVWLWVANPGPTTTGPNSTSATAGDVTVTATAKFSGMSIDMGDGTTIECTGPGTEYPGTGIEESPDCGHVYEQMSDDQPNGLYTLNITAHWTVDWASNTGEDGQIPLDLTTDKQLRIGSYQSVVTDVS
ncbi:hypothetical protein GCM10009626_33830 [Brachybacterium sacelli]